MSHAIVKSIALACLAAGAVSAHADSVDFNGFANGSKSVRIALSSPNVAVNLDGNAGGFLTTRNGGPSFTTFCVDLYQTISFADPAYTDYSLVSGSSFAFANTHAATDLGKLYSEGHVLNSAANEAAFQIAVWEIAYETSGSYNLANGSAKFTGGSAADDGALRLASTWLANLATTTDTYNISVLKSPGHQDVIFAAPVPEPSTYALLAGGLLAIGFGVRRRSAR